MAEREAALGEPRLKLWAKRACLDARRMRALVDLEDAIHAREIEADGAAEIAIVLVLDAADDARAAAKGAHGEALIARPVEDRDDLGLILWERDEIGRRGI